MPTLGQLRHRRLPCTDGKSTLGQETNDHARQQAEEHLRCKPKRELSCAKLPNSHSAKRSGDLATSQPRRHPLSVDVGGGRCCTRAPWLKAPQSDSSVWNGGLGRRVRGPCLRTRSSVCISAKHDADTICNLQQHVCPHGRCSSEVEGFLPPRQPHLGKSTIKRQGTAVSAGWCGSNPASSISGCSPPSAAPWAAQSRTALYMTERSPLHEQTET